MTTQAEKSPAVPSDSTLNESPAVEKSFQHAVPEYLRIYGFDVLNLGAYYCAVGPALALYIKYLGGGTTYMGLVMACMPACQLLQILVAPHLERWGIKRVMMTSLILRNVMHLFLALIPFIVGWTMGAAGGTGSASGTAHPGGVILAILFFVLLSFDLCQGVAFSGWMTWVHWLVPDKYRGRYFAFEQMMNNVGQICFSGVAGWILGVQGTHSNYGSIFLLGALSGWASIMFLGRVSAIPKKQGKPEFNSMQLGWMKTVWSMPAFRRMMYVIWAHQIMLSVGYFFIYFQKDSLHLTDRFIMVMNTVGIAGGVLSVYVWGKLADRFGSKPVMALAYYLVIAVNAYWLGLGLGLPLFQAPVLILVQFLYVAGLQGYVVTNMRYVLGSLPPEKVVFGSIFYNLTVQVSTMFGAMFWGRFLDLTFLRSLKWGYGGMRIDRFTVVFACMVLLALVARAFIHRLTNRESHANAFHVAFYAIREDKVTRGIALFVGFGLAALPVSYLFQPAAWRTELGLWGYCGALLEGLEGVLHPPQVLPVFLAVLGVSLFCCLLLCAGQRRQRQKHEIRLSK